MYLAVMTVVVGFAITYRALGLWIYAAALIVALHVRVLKYEEPWLARTFAAQWLAYRSEVPRWIGWPQGWATARHRDPAG